MDKKYSIEDIDPDEIKHADIDKFEFDAVRKIFYINLCHVGLKDGIFLYDCTITITDWWDFEVLQYHKDTIINKFKGNDIPELDSIVGFTYDDNVLILEDLCGIDELYHFKFTKPNIQITGEYDPD